MKLSLRMRVLWIVSAINLVVFGLGSAIATRDLDLQLRAEYSQSLFQRLQSTVGPQGDINVATILQWPSWKYFDDAIIVHANLVRDERNAIQPQGAFLNPLGQWNRPADFDTQPILRDIAHAIESNSVLPSHNGTVMPILDPRGGVWGGCWFSLAGFHTTRTLLARLSPWYLISTVLLTLATFWVLRRFVLDPVAELAEAARRVAAGDFGRRIPDPGRDDEVARLIRTFNAMTDKVAGYNAELARDVAAATDQVRRAEAAAMTQRRLAATGELAAGIAHEINNPLGGLLNAVETLEKPDVTPEKRAQYHALLRGGLERIRATVGQLLRFTPRSSNPVPLALVDPVFDAISLVQHRARALGVEVRLDGRDPAAAVEAARRLPPVLGQANELGQVVLNLLVNSLDAIEASARGRGRIDVTIEARDDRLVLVVADDGPGVDPSQLPRVADLFYTTKDVGKGTGLGLSIVHGIVRHHGGDVRITSERGRGFQVEIRLPAWSREADGKPRS